MKRTSALLTLSIAAAPTPCTTRAALSMTSESDSAQPSEAKVKTTSPTRKTRR